MFQRVGGTFLSMFRCVYVPLQCLVCYSWELAGTANDCGIEGQFKQRDLFVLCSRCVRIMVIWSLPWCLIFAWSWSTSNQSFWLITLTCGVVVLSPLMSTCLCRIVGSWRLNCRLNRYPGYELGRLCTFTRRLVVSSVSAPIRAEMATGFLSAPSCCASVLCPYLCIFIYIYIYCRCLPLFIPSCSLLMFLLLLLRCTGCAPSALCCIQSDCKWNGALCTFCVHVIDRGTGLEFVSAFWPKQTNEQRNAHVCVLVCLNEFQDVFLGSCDISIIVGFLKIVTLVMCWIGFVVPRDWGFLGYASCIWLVIAMGISYARM